MCTWKMATTCSTELQGPSWNSGSHTRSAEKCKQENNPYHYHCLFCTGLIHSLLTPSLLFAFQTMVLFSPQIKVTKLGKSMHEDEILALQKLSNLLCI